MRAVEVLKHAGKAGQARRIKASDLAVLGGDARRVLTRAGRRRAAGELTGSEREAHLDATMGWLGRAQDSSEDRGVAATYTLGTGWTASYPETTGYLIPTFLDYASTRERPEFRRRAVEMGEWLLAIQLEDGAFQAGAVDEEVRRSVFNTGQILFGLVRLFDETHEDRWMAALTSTAEWLVDVMDPDGSWSRFTYRGIRHSYYSRVAWALLEAFRASGRAAFKDAAARHLEWVLGNQAENGWITANGFHGDRDPFTHTIVYSAEGLLGGGAILEDDRFVAAAARVADALQKRYEASGRLPGTLGPNWDGGPRYVCLTGNAQLAGLLQQLHLLLGGDERLRTASALIGDVTATQSLRSGNLGIRGAVKGSDPIWGAYMSYRYPNWAAKFLADALLFGDGPTRSGRGG